jgi:hypothetical protein
MIGVVARIVVQVVPGIPAAVSDAAPEPGIIIPPAGPVGAVVAIIAIVGTAVPGIVPAVMPCVIPVRIVVPGSVEFVEAGLVGLPIEQFRYNIEITFLVSCEVLFVSAAGSFGLPRFICCDQLGP